MTIYKAIGSSLVSQTGLKRVGIKPIHIHPSLPWAHEYNERFNGTLRSEILNANWFQTTRKAQSTINYWIKLNNLNAIYDKKKLNISEIKNLIKEIRQKKVLKLTLT